MVQATFDYEAGQAAKEAGLDRACNPHFRKDLLGLAQYAAHSYANAHDSVTYDDVYRILDGIGREPELLGNAAGAVFRGDEWECIGWKPSERVTNHKRPIRIWRLR
jgi:hypothetical protein